ncbi:FMN-binding protein [Streptomyces corynorhini]|uniref:FMN-binding protein n=1 Tax=Streptomyces corynorhini TaxID=2282652 RepID=A0A370B9N8_9ACTN|nr:FMN-binding protein [Streptomyces corynorhini]RDG38510.1 FMN-binding protein [Streptomyces corynorhini]
MKRKHPLRRIMIGVAATASGVVLLLALKQPGGTPVAGAAAQTGTGVSATAGGAGGGPGARTVLGDVVSTQYGPVQVRLTLDGGRITEAEAVQAPDGDARSQSVTADAVPKLNQAALTAQSAQVDAVSGASYTSKGYRESLQSALDKAGEGAGADAGTRPSAEPSGPGEGEAADAGASAGAGAGAGSDADAGTGGATGGSTGGSTGGATGGSTGGTGGGSAEAGAPPAGPRTVLGDAVNTQYGTVQVRLTVDGGRITEAEAVQAPDGDARSQSVTADAVPKLNQAALTAQSAQVDAVSGASYTSKGYRESLQSALDKAGV